MEKLPVEFHHKLYIWVFPKIGVFTPNHDFNRVFHYFHHPFWGFSHYFWKHPYRWCILHCILSGTRGIFQRGCWSENLSVTDIFHLSQSKCLNIWNQQMPTKNTLIQFSDIVWPRDFLVAQLVLTFKQYHYKYIFFCSKKLFEKKHS